MVRWHDDTTKQNPVQKHPLAKNNISSQKLRSIQLQLQPKLSYHKNFHSLSWTIRWAFITSPPTRANHLFHVSKIEEHHKPHVLAVETNHINLF